VPHPPFQAGLIQTDRPGVYRITEEGKKVVAHPPAKLDLRFLDTIPRHNAWFHAAKKVVPPGTSPIGRDISSLSPTERIEDAFSQLNISLASELQEQMATMDPFRFEQLVVDLLFAMGYGGSREEAAKVTKKSGDEGIDGVINEDRLGLDVIYIQAKRWKHGVGRKEIQSFCRRTSRPAGQQRRLHHHQRLRPNCHRLRPRPLAKVILIDGTRLAELMIEHNIGVTTTRTLSLKRIDSDYFEEK